MGAQYFDNAAYPAMLGLYTADLIALEQVNEGYCVYSGCAVSVSGTAGKVDMTAGVVFQGTTELTVGAVTAASTSITSLADSVYPRWVALEIDTSGALQFNAGPASATYPPKPIPTSGRVLVAWLYIPVNATIVDIAWTISNGNAKLIDARQIVSVHPSRKLGVTTGTFGNAIGTSFTSILGSTITIPANSLSVGDVFRFRIGGLTLNNVTATTIEFQILWGATVIFDWTTASLTTSGSLRAYYLSSDFIVALVGASGNLTAVTSRNVVTVPADYTSMATSLEYGGAGVTVDTTASKVIDIKAKFGAASVGAVVSSTGLHVEKIPV